MFKKLTSSILMLLLLETQAFAGQSFVQINEFLNSFQNLQADFSQVDSEGEMASGKIFIQKPGKIKISYETPEKSDIIIKNSTLIHQDHELETTSYLNVKNHILSEMFKDHIKIENLNPKIAYVKGSEVALEMNSVSLQNVDETESFLIVFKNGQISQILRSAHNNVSIAMDIKNIKTLIKLPKEVFTAKDFKK